MPWQRFIVAFGIASLLAGCGTSASSPTPTPVKAVATTTYTDHKYGFSFKYPTTWSAPSGGGSSESNGGIQQYVVNLTIPGNAAQVSLTMDGDVQSFPPFTNGHKAYLPNDTHTYVYYHRTVAQWPAMRVERYSGSQLSEIDTFVNTRKESYDIRTLAASPPFSGRTLAGYEIVVRSFKPPFS